LFYKYTSNILINQIKNPQFPEGFQLLFNFLIKL
jgi:hypothetical protein